MLRGGGDAIEIETSSDHCEHSLTPMEVIEQQQQQQQEQQQAQEQSTLSITTLVSTSSKRTLEANLNARLDAMSGDAERIRSLAQSILFYENSPTPPPEALPDQVTTSTNLSTNAVDQRCAVGILLDYFCHFDPQIVNKMADVEQCLLFTSRRRGRPSARSASMSSAMSMSMSMGQSFLLALFIHQASWCKLFACAQQMLNMSLFFTEPRLNPAVLLDFYSALIHMPELWKGTEATTHLLLDKYDEQAHVVLNIDHRQLCSLVDLVVQEMCELYAERSKSDDTDSTTTDIVVGVLKSTLMRRIYLLKHFFGSAAIVAQSRRALFDTIVAHVHWQRNNLHKLTAFDRGAFQRIQNLFLFCLYLEENELIGSISNPDRLFASIFHQVDIPTQVTTTITTTTTKVVFSNEKT